MPFKFNPLTGQLDLVNATSAGTVSSVALADGSSTPIYTISGSPVTSTGTLTFTLNNENANLVFAGPGTGSPAQPTFRSLVAADIPSLPYLTSINGNTTQAQLIVAGTGISVSSLSGTTTITNTSPSSGGTVTSVSVVSANGLAGTVATATTTPAITLSTTITGILQGNGTAISAATTGNLTDVGTDGITVTNGTGAVLGSGTSLSQHVADTTHNGYLSSVDWNTFNNKQPAGNYITALTGDVSATGPGSVAATLATVNANVGSFTNANITVNAKGLITAASNGTSGTVTSVAFSDGSTTPIYTISGSPITSSGTITETLVTQSANQVFAGPTTGAAAQPTFRSLVAADIPALGYVTAVTASAPITSTGGTTPNIAVNSGNLTDVGTDGIVITGGTGAVLGSGTSIAQHVADSTHNGYLSSTDWSTFNNKQPAGNYITALTGDATATGPGSVPITFATVNANVGSFGTASSVSSVTVNAKGLVTAASNVAIQIAESQVTNLVSDLAAKQSTTLTNTHLLVGNASNVATDVAASGDLTLANTGAFTFNTVNANVGSFGTASSVGSFTVNAKGLLTAASNTAIQITESQVTNLVTDLANKQSTTLTNTHLLVGNASNVATDVAASGDLTLANTGAFTLNTVNANVGSFGTATATGTFTVNAKGLITAASSTPIQITESQVTNLVTDLAGKQSTTLTNTHILVGNASNVATDVAMSGDATIANTGALTLATVNANVGSFTSANITVNAKGLITAASNGTGGAGVTVLNKSANYTVLSADNGTYFTLDTSGAAFTLTLPTPSSGFHIKFVDSTGSFGTNNLTLAPSSTEKIEGLAASKVFQTNWGGWEVFSNGTDWFLI